MALLKSAAVMSERPYSAAWSRPVRSAYFSFLCCTWSSRSSGSGDIDDLAPSAIYTLLSPLHMIEFRPLGQTFAPPCRAFGTVDYSASALAEPQARDVPSLDHSIGSASSLRGHHRS